MGVSAADWPGYPRSRRQPQTAAMTQTRPRKPRVYLGPNTWALIRRRYLAGETAPALAAVFGCTEAAIRKRASREGWTKRSLALALDVEAPAEATTEAATEPAPTPESLAPAAAARRALDQAVRWLLAGQTGRAAEAARVAEAMARAAARLDDGAAAAADDDDEAELEAVRRRVAAMVEAARAEGRAEGRAEARTTESPGGVAAA